MPLVKPVSFSVGRICDLLLTVSAEGYEGYCITKYTIYKVFFFLSTLEQELLVA